MSPLLYHLSYPASYRAAKYGGFTRQNPVFVEVNGHHKERNMSQTTTKSQGTILKYSQETHLLTWISAFLVDRKAQGLSPGTLEFYHKKLKLFTDYCQAQLITQIPEITPNQIHLYLLYLEE
jgi:hypothetical protein